MAVRSRHRAERMRETERERQKKRARENSGVFGLWRASEGERASERVRRVDRRPQPSFPSSLTHLLTPLSSPFSPPDPPSHPLCPLLAGPPCSAAQLAMQSRRVALRPVAIQNGKTCVHTWIFLLLFSVYSEITVAHCLQDGTLVAPKPMTPSDGLLPGTFFGFKYQLAAWQAARGGSERCEGSRRSNRQQANRAWRSARHLDGSNGKTNITSS
eukprot:497328-Rhodomonas_salina.2